MDLRRAVLVGFSMGAGEVVRYVTRHGADRVAGIVLIGGATPMLQGAPGNPDGIDPAVFEAVRRDCLMADFPGWIDANMIPFVTPETSAGLQNWVRDMALRTSLQALVECNRALTAADFRAELRGITVPTLVIQGDADQTCPLSMTGQRTAALVPSAELRVYGGAPHGLFLTHRERLNADLTDFVRRAARRSTS